MTAFAGLQEGAIFGPNLFAQSPTLSTGNVTGVTLFNAPTGGTAVTCQPGEWDSAAALLLLVTASGD